MSGSGELIKLTNAEGLVVDSLTYDDKAPWPIEADGEGATLELLDPESDNSLGENWKASVGHGTPGRKNSVVTSLDEINKVIIPEKFSLSQNFPNPFNPSTKIQFTLSSQQNTTLKIYDILGNEIETLVSGIKPAGVYEVMLDATNLPSGVYFYKLQAGEFVGTKKMILLR